MRVMAFTLVLTAVAAWKAPPRVGRRAALAGALAQADLVGRRAAFARALSQAPLVGRGAALAGVLSQAPLAAKAIAPEWDKDYIGVGAERNALSDFEVVAMQQAPNGKIDLNNALITDYKVLPGMYPHAAGLLASNGPYKSVNDILRLPGATESDKMLFNKYKSSFVALEPGRTFYERINGRQST